MAGDVTDQTFTTLSFDDLKFDIQSLEFRQLQLRYRGEGNDNMVLQAPNLRYVLRFHKSKSIEDEFQRNEELRTSFAYYYLFIKPLFSAYCSIPIIARVPESEIKKLDDALFPLRPKNRLEKRVFHSGVEVHPDYAFIPLYLKYLSQNKENIMLLEAPSSNRLKDLLSWDYLEYRNFVFTLLTEVDFPARILNESSSCGDTICIEIKPKQAWTAVPDRHAMCAYCMNQFFKLSSGKIKSQSEYCPLDLFSGNRIRMRKALKALMKTPQNNLRIFKNGDLVHGEDDTANIDSILQKWLNCDPKRRIDIFCHLIEEALLMETVSDPNSIHLSCKIYEKSQQRDLCPSFNMKLLEESLAYSSHCVREISLPGNSILGRIFQLQKVDESGIGIVYDYYETHKSEFTSEFGYIDELINHSQVVDGQIRIPPLNVVEAYLFSTAAKDLSILIAFQPSRNCDSNKRTLFVMDERNQLYEANISVVDVGPKPVSCVKKHWKRDAAVLTACARQLYPTFVLE